MFKDITLGQYYPTESVIHSLDARVKFTGTMVYIIVLFVVRGIPGYVLAFAALFALVKLSRVPFKFMVRGLRSILFILIIMMLFNIFLTPGT